MQLKVSCLTMWINYFSFIFQEIIQIILILEEYQKSYIYIYLRVIYNLLIFKVSIRALFVFEKVLGINFYELINIEKLYIQCDC